MWAEFINTMILLLYNSNFKIYHLDHIIFTKQNPTSSNYYFTLGFYESSDNTKGLSIDFLPESKTIKIYVGDGTSVKWTCIATFTAD